MGPLKASVGKPDLPTKRILDHAKNKIITLSQCSRWVSIMAAVAAWLLLKAKAVVTIPVVLNNSVVRCAIKAHSCSNRFQ